MTKKVIPFDLRIKSSEVTSYSFGPKAKVYTNDLNAVELQFKVTDTSDAEMSGSTASVLLFMRDGSFFQNTDVTRVGNLFTYAMKPNQIKHRGIAQVQLVIKKGTIENASPLLEFEIVGGLETKPITEVMIQDWTSLTAEAKAFVDQIEGFTLAEFVGNKMGEELANLEVNYAGRLTGLETKDTQLTAQLAQTTTDRLAQNIQSGNGLYVGSAKAKETLVTFIDDDGYSEVWSRLKPIFESRGVPCTIAVVSDWVGQTGRLTKNQILSLQNGLGWEVASHEKTHIAMGAVTDENKVYDEVVNSKKELLDMGFDVKNIVYPYGQSSDLLKRVASQVYKVGVTTATTSNNQTNTTPISRFSLLRSPLGSYAGTDNTLEYYKATVDKAIAEGSWLVFMTHIWAQDATQDNYLGQVIDYIKSKNVKIVNLDEGLNHFGDKLSVDGTLRITNDDKVITDKLVMGVYASLVDNYTKATDYSFLTTNYGKNQVLYSKINTAQAAGFPGNSPGMLITDMTTIEKGYIFETYRIYNSGNEYTRILKADGTWTAFTRPPIITKKTLILGQLSFAPNETKVRDVDLTGLTGITAQTGLIATCRDATIDNFSYNIRASSATSGKLRMTNMTNASVTFYAADWDITAVVV